MRRIKHIGIGKGSSDENELNLSLCSVTSQRKFSVQILRNPHKSNVWVGVVQLDRLFQMGGFHGAHWYIKNDYLLRKCNVSEMDEEYKGKTIPEGAVVFVDIDDTRRALTFIVNGQET